MSFLSTKPDASNKTLFKAAHRGDINAVIQALDGATNESLADTATLSLTRENGCPPNGTWESHTRTYITDVNFPCRQDGLTPLMVAAREGHHDVVKLLLDRKAKINTVDDLQQTALHKAADRGFGLCVDVLLNGKANINVLDTACRTALDLAEFGGAMPSREEAESRKRGAAFGDHKEIVEKLRKFPQRKNIVTDGNVSPAEVRGRSQRTYNDKLRPEPGVRYGTTVSLPSHRNMTTYKFGASSAGGRLKELQETQ
mmetsp:Transcript_21599/g.52647  ORF Transcript_21599/g.52647 Transcript_21599/m.52647 type:complete len:256 (-) Transcript_21599:175-942(-)